MKSSLSRFRFMKNENVAWGNGFVLPFKLQPPWPQHTRNLVRRGNSEREESSRRVSSSQWYIA